MEVKWCSTGEPVIALGSGHWPMNIPVSSFILLFPKLMPSPSHPVSLLATLKVFSHFICHTERTALIPVNCFPWTKPVSLFRSAFSFSPLPHLSEKMVVFPTAYLSTCWHLCLQLRYFIINFRLMDRYYVLFFLLLSSSSKMTVPE